MTVRAPFLKRYLLPASLLGLVYLLLNGAVRARIAWPLYQSPEISASELFRVFLLGLVNDLVAALLMALSICILLLAWPGRSLAKRAVLASLLTLEFLVLLLILGIDLAAWLELDMRVGRFAEQYIVYFEATAHFGLEYARNVHWSFWLSCAAVTAATAWLAIRISPVLAEVSCERNVRWSLSVFTLTSSLIMFFYFGLAEPQINEKRSLNDAAENTFTNMLRTWIRDDTRWNGVFKDIPEHEAQERLANIWPNHKLDPNSGIRHLVLIVEESFGGDQWINQQSRERLMPEFLRLSNEGMLFTSAFGTGLRTVRGIEALLQGIIPVSGFSRTTLGPGSRLPSLSASLKAAGFRTGFVYGGWPSFTNFADYWSSIGFDRVLTRNDFEDPWFETSWGIADEIVLDRLLEEMDQMTGDSQRVFLATLTISNHLPFTFPEGRVPYAPGERVHAISYADWALGRFMREARTKNWFPDTLFVIASDHGYGRLGNTRIPIEPHRVPVLFYAPDHIPAGRVDALSSSLEVPKTILCVLDLPECAEFHGRNLLALEDHDHGVAPIEFGSFLALVKPQGVTVLLRNESFETWQWNESGRLGLAEPNEELARDASAVFRTAMQDFYGELR